MNRRYIMWSMFWSLLSLIWILISYYGIDRYCKLGFCDYSESYLKLPRVNSKGKVIISISTDECDFGKIKRMINSVLDQTVHVDQIILSVNENNLIEIPSDLKTSNIIIEHKLSSDYGKCNALCSPLTREKDGDAKIIVLNDKQVYGPDLVNDLIQASEKNPDNVIYVKGYNAKQFLNNNSKEDVNENNDIIDVSAGVLVKPRFLSTGILKCESCFKNAPNATLSAHLQKLVNLTKIEDADTFYKKLGNDEDEKKGTMFYAAFFKSL